eukprot:3769989-Pleurochrysis_carterae.AAC.1
MDDDPPVAPARRRRRTPLHRCPGQVPRVVESALPRVPYLACTQQQVVREEGRGPVDAALLRVASRAGRRRRPEMCSPERAAQFARPGGWVLLPHALQRLRERVPRDLWGNVAPRLPRPEQLHGRH